MLNIICLTLFVIIFFSACSAPQKKDKPPENLTSGVKEIKKGTVYYTRGCYRSALDNFFRAHEIFSSSDRIKGVAMSLNNIGNVYRVMGDFQSAILFFEESFRIYSHIEDDQGMVQTLSNKAATLIEQNRLAEASKVLDQAGNIEKRMNRPYPPLLNNWGVLFTLRKQYDQAEAILKKAVDMISPENYFEQATANYALGKLMIETGQYSRAIEYLNTALDADRKSEFHKGMAQDLEAMANVYAAMEKPGQAIFFYQRAVKIFALIRNSEKVESIMHQLETIADKNGQDITVTRHFVKKWLEGKILEGVCQ